MAFGMHYDVKKDILGNNPEHMSALTSASQWHVFFYDI